MNEELLRKAIKTANDQGTDEGKFDDCGRKNFNFDLDDEGDQEEFVTKVCRLYNHLERIELAKEGN